MLDQEHSRQCTEQLSGIGLLNSSHSKEMDDLEFALQLSLAEEESKRGWPLVAEEDDFSALSPSPRGKGKGKRGG